MRQKRTTPDQVPALRREPEDGVILKRRFRRFDQLQL